MIRLQRRVGKVKHAIGAATERRREAVFLFAPRRYIAAHESVDGRYCCKSPFWGQEQKYARAPWLVEITSAH